MEASGSSHLIRIEHEENFRCAMPNFYAMAMLLGAIAQRVPASFMCSAMTHQANTYPPLVGVYKSRAPDGGRLGSQAILCADRPRHYHELKTSYRHWGLNTGRITTGNNPNIVYVEPGPTSLLFNGLGLKIPQPARKQRSCSGH